MAILSTENCYAYSDFALITLMFPVKFVHNAQKGSTGRAGFDRLSVIQTGGMSIRERVFGGTIE